MKKLLAIILSAVMATTLLAACTTKPASTPTPPASAPGSQSKTEGEALSGKLVIWSHQNGAWNESHKKMAARFMEANPGVTIEYEAFPYMDFQQKTQTSLLTDQSADIYELWGGWALDYAPTGALAKVPEFIAADMGDNYFAPTLGAFTYDGGYYGVPIEYNIEYGGLVVNKTLFDAKKLAYPTTWEELEKIADETSIRKGEIMEMRGFEFVTGDGLTNLFLAMILSQGGSYLSSDGYQVDFSTPEAVAAMSKLVEYIKERGWTNLDGLNVTTASDPGGTTEVFRDGAMMSMVGPWAVSMGEMFGKVYGTDYDYVPMPHYGEKNAFVSETGWGFAVSEKSKQKELAWKYIEWFNQTENMLEHNIACSQLPARKSLAEEPKYLEAMPYTKPILDILGDGQYIGYLNTTDLKQSIMNIFTDLTTLNKFGSVEAALKDVQDKANALNAKK